MAVPAGWLQGDTGIYQPAPAGINPYDYALWWEAPESNLYNGYITERPPLPTLASTATPQDQALYQALQTIYADPNQAPGILDQIRFGALGRGQASDPQLQGFVGGQRANAARTDKFALLGDNLFPVLALLGLAAGGAALAPAVAGEAGAAGAGAAGTEAALAAGGVGPVVPVTAPSFAGAAVGAGELGSFGATAPAGFTAAEAAGTVGAGGTGLAGTAAEFAAGGAGTLGVGGTGALGLAGATGGAGAATLGELPAAAGPWEFGTGAGGILGTGITPAQAKAALGVLGTGAQLAGGLGGAGAGGPLSGSNTTTTSGQLDPQTLELLNAILGQQFPDRFGGWLQAIDSFTQRANASPIALDQLASPQLRQMGQAILQARSGASRQFGPFGGSQIPAAWGHVAGQQDYAGAFGNPAVKAGQDLSGFVGQTGLPLPGGRTSTSTTTYPTDPSQIAAAIQGLGNLGVNLANLYNTWPGGGSTADFSRNAPSNFGGGGEF